MEDGKQTYMSYEAQQDCENWTGCKATRKYVGLPEDQADEVECIADKCWKLCPFNVANQGKNLPQFKIEAEPDLYEVYGPPGEIEPKVEDFFNDEEVDI